MKSLEERKKFRKQQRAEQLKESGAVNQDTGVITDENDGKGSDYSEMTIDQLKDAAKALGAEVPKDKTVKADILTYVENLAAFKAQEASDEEKKSAGWKPAQ